MSTQDLVDFIKTLNDFLRPRTSMHSFESNEKNYLFNLLKEFSASNGFVSRHNEEYMIIEKESKTFYVHVFYDELKNLDFRAHNNFSVLMNYVKYKQSNPEAKDYEILNVLLG